MKNLIFILLLIPQFLLSQTQYPPPKIEIADHTLSRFITELTLAIGKKDKTFILKHISPQIMNSFGGNGGIDEFKEMWDFDSPNSPFWKITEKLLILGGSKYEEGSNHYSIPYIFSDWGKIGDYDPFEYSIITGENVNVRDKPTTKGSRVVGQFSYDVVSFDSEKTYETRNEHQELEPNDSGGSSWYYVCSVDKKICGFVYWKYVYSAVGYRIGFEKVDGNWQITYLIAGD